MPDSHKNGPTHLQAGATASTCLVDRKSSRLARADKKNAAAISRAISTCADPSEHRDLTLCDMPAEIVHVSDLAIRLTDLRMAGMRLLPCSIFKRFDPLKGLMSACILIRPPLWCRPVMCKRLWFQGAALALGGHYAAHLRSDGPPARAAGSFRKPRH